MGNSLLCKPYDMTAFSSTAASLGDKANLLNDEPGLIFQGAVNTATNVVFDLGSAKALKAIALLGLTPHASAQIVIKSSPNSDMSGSTTVATIPVNFAANRSDSYSKAFYYNISGTAAARYWQISMSATTGYALRLWRVLLCDAIQPSEGISVGAEEGIDDRSVRRYARNGRRVIDPTVICPTFQGVWPWLTEAEAKGWFKPFIRGNGATKPAMFVLDPDDTTYGEDGIIYGDLEKANKLGYEDGCYSFNLAIVGIAA